MNSYLRPLKNGVKNFFKREDKKDHIARSLDLEVLLSCVIREISCGGKEI